VTLCRLVRFTPFVGLLAAGGQVTAQSVSPTLSDATVVSRGMFRLMAQTDWTRFNEVYGPNGDTRIQLGDALGGNLGVARLPLLGPAETGARQLAGNAVTISAGRLVVSADSRSVSVPFSVEYGLTNRISLGILVPIVQSRTVVTTQLNPKGDTTANVGTNPAAFHGVATAFAANGAVASGLGTAGAQLSQQLTQCESTPTASGCPALLARSSEASALIASAENFVDGVRTLYGISPLVPGSLFVPISGSALQTTIDANLAAIRAGFSSFGISPGTGALAAAGAPAANAQLQQLVRNSAFGIGLDSIGTSQQTSVGDIELGATALLFDSFGTGRIGLRGVAAGVVRLGTGHPPRENVLLDTGTGDGQTDFEVRGALDAMVGSRLLATVAGTFTIQTGSRSFIRLPATPGTPIILDSPVSGSISPGNMYALRLNPRFLVTPALMVGALGTMSARSADAVTITSAPATTTTFAFASGSWTTYAGGLTLGYSSAAARSGTSGLPAEVLFTHLETLGANGAGPAKSFRDAIELRIYLGTRR
jgi:hypothetical protein